MTDDARERFAAVAIDPLTGCRIVQRWYDREDDARAHANRIGGTVIVGGGLRGLVSDHAEQVRRP